MKAKLIVEGQEFNIEISDSKLQALISPPKTGYEQVKAGKNFFAVRADGTIFEPTAGGKDNNYYDVANYYSDRAVAENNSRADKLIRQLRRFAVEHRENSNPTERYCIYYLKNPGILQLRRDSESRFIGPWFDSLHSGSQAIETFHDELMWYFTEYKDSL